jgi:hypothetical protein
MPGMDVSAPNAGTPGTGAPSMDHSQHRE